MQTNANFLSKQYQADANRFDGSIDSANACKSWLLRYKNQVTCFVEQPDSNTIVIRLKTENRIEVVLPNRWIVFYPCRGFSVFDDNQFEFLFKKS